MDESSQEQQDRTADEEIVEYRRLLDKALRRAILEPSTEEQALESARSAGW